jgi:aerobic carbon-monoxide dehydrogenase medium subunit
MYPKAIKSYFAPTEISEVLVLLGQHKAAAKLLAGGQSLLPLMKLRLVEPRVIIDLNRVQGLNEISERAGVLTLGAMVRHAELATHPLIRRSYRLLADAAGNIGDPQIRNRGTLAGSLVHADPAADYPPAIVALNGRLVLTKPNGSTRIVTADDFFIGPLTSALDEDELVTRIRIPAPTAHTGGAYTKNCQVAGDFAIISVAAQVMLDPSGQCRHAAIVIGGVMPKATRAPKASTLVVGTSLDDATLAQAGETAAAEVATQDDGRASASYRTQLIRVTVPRILRQAATRARKVEA